MRIRLCRFASVLSGFFSFLIATNASHAVTVYSYTGGNFTSIFLDGTPPAGSYTTAMSVSGTFTVAAPFAANLIAENFSPSILLDLSFTDGRQTINLANLDPVSFGTFIVIDTDSLGGITGFQLGFTSLQPTTVGGQFGQIIASFGNQSGQIAECLAATGGSCTSFGIDKAQGGGSLVLLSTDVVQTPLPAALPLFATGLGALGLLGWRRKRKAAAHPA